VQAAKLRERNEKTTAPARMAQAQESAMRFAQDSKAIALYTQASDLYWTLPLKIAMI
jgi:hypothetical protein